MQFETETVSLNTAHGMPVVLNTFFASIIKAGNIISKSDQETNSGEERRKGIIHTPFFIQQRKSAYKAYLVVKNKVSQ